MNDINSAAPVVAPVVVATAGTAASVAGAGTGAGTIAIPSFGLQQEQGAYSFFSYDPKVEHPAPEGARLVTALYRSKAGKQAARPNEAMFAPDWITPELVTENSAVLTEYLISFLQDQEQEMIRAKHKDFSTVLGESTFTLPALLDYMASKGAGARLSGEVIGKWYKESGLEAALGELYLEKTGMDTKAAQIVEFIGKKLQGLASPKVVWTEAEKEKLLPLIESAEQSSLRDKLLARIAGMTGVCEDMLDAL